MSEPTKEPTNFGAGFSAYRSKLAAALEAAGFDPTIILTLLTALLPLITSLCTPKSMRRRLGNRARLVSAFAQAIPSLSFGEAFRIADLHFDVAASASDEDLVAFGADCCS